MMQTLCQEVMDFQSLKFYSVCYSEGILHMKNNQTRKSRELGKKMGKGDIIGEKTNLAVHILRPLQVR